MIEPKDRLTFDGNFCDIAKCREERSAHVRLHRGRYI